MNGLSAALSAPRHHLPRGEDFLLFPPSLQPYGYRIVATGSAGDCASPEQTLTTGAATGAPTVTRTTNDAAARAPGFIITSDGSFADGSRLPMEVAVGDLILFGKYSGSEVKIDGEEYLILREDEILAVLS